jgi:hypothetical protein
MGKTWEVCSECLRNSKEKLVWLELKEPEIDWWEVI